VPSSWIEPRPTKRDGKNRGAMRYRVRFRIGGRESKIRFGGSFKRREDARTRQRKIDGLLAAGVVPTKKLLAAADVPTAPQSPLFRDQIEPWQESRIDVAESTKTQHRTSVNRALPFVGDLRVDKIEASDVQKMVQALHLAGHKRATIKKTVHAVAMVLEYSGRDPNPARGGKVKLPYEEKQEIEPPTAAHVETVFRLIAAQHRLALLFLDHSGARVAAIDLTQVKDYDETFIASGSAQRRRSSGGRCGSCSRIHSTQRSRRRWGPASCVPKNVACLRPAVPMRSGLQSRRHARKRRSPPSARTTCGIAASASFIARARPGLRLPTSSGIRTSRKRRTPTHT
jgi:hypothetical protein